MEYQKEEYEIKQKLQKTQTKIKNQNESIKVETNIENEK